MTFILTNYFCCDPVSIQGRFWGGDLNLPSGAAFSPSQWSWGHSGLSGAWVSESLPDTLPLGHELKPARTAGRLVSQRSLLRAPWLPLRGPRPRRVVQGPRSTREPVGDRPPQAPGGVPGLGPGNTLGWFCIRPLPDEPSPGRPCPFQRVVMGVPCPLGQRKGWSCSPAPTPSPAVSPQRSPTARPCSERLREAGAVPAP